MGTDFWPICSSDRRPSGAAPGDDPVLLLRVKK
jgi:hypothetical protein